MSVRNNFQKLFEETQKQFLAHLLDSDPTLKIRSDRWDRPDQSGHGGGGLTCALSGGSVIEKGGVNVSAVQGSLAANLSKSLVGREEVLPFFATGISVVIHCHSPMVPTMHFNTRYLEVGDSSWVGGGADLTPYYLFDEDAIEFHQAMKRACDRFEATAYPRYKKWCDEYFYLPHRGETRGVGGIFFDYLGKDGSRPTEEFWPLVEGVCQEIGPVYTSLLKRRYEMAFTEGQKRFQLVRRGRYVEFNLLYDRGTEFGLKSGGRTESILMSLPAEVCWEYEYQIPQGGPEERLLAVLRQPRDWLSY